MDIHNGYLFITVPGTCGDQEFNKESLLEAQHEGPRCKNRHSHSRLEISISVILVGYKLPRPSLFKGWEGRRPGQAFSEIKNSPSKIDYLARAPL